MLLHIVFKLGGTCFLCFVLFDLANLLFFCVFSPFLHFSGDFSISVESLLTLTNSVVFLGPVFEKSPLRPKFP